MPINHDHPHWMQQALLLAQQAALADEVPVGALVVYNNDIIGQGFNRPIGQNNPVAHAEIIALQQAAQVLQNYRLPDCDLYVTLEPCMMCAGAMIHARIRRLIFGAYEPKAGVIVSQAKILESAYLNHHIDVLGGILQEPCSQILTDFFKHKRSLKAASSRLSGYSRPMLQKEDE